MFLPPRWFAAAVLAAAPCAVGSAQTLTGDVTQIDLLAGGTQTLSLTAGLGFANDLYFVLGSATGTTGFTISGVHVPLDIDPYFLLLLNNPNHPPLFGSFGVLNAFGDASCLFKLPAGLTISPGFIYHAYGVIDGATGLLLAASNVVDVELVQGTPRLVINEIDYDQPSTDTSEFVEIANAGTATADLTNVVLELVNGSDGSVYNTIPLSAAGPTLAPGEYLVVASLTVAVPPSALLINFGPISNNIENGSPDGVRLVDAVSGAFIDGVHYEGLMSGTGEGGTAPADDPGSTGSIQRCPDASDTDDNGVDFVFSTFPTPGSANSCPP